MNPSQITACAAKVIIMSQLKCLYELRKNYALPDKVHNSNPSETFSCLPAVSISSLGHTNSVTAVKSGQI